MRLNSWLAMALQELIQISSRLKIDFKSTHGSKSFQNILIQINSWLKKLFRIWIQIDSWLKKLSGILIRIRSWLNDSNQLLYKYFINIFKKKYLNVTEDVTGRVKRLFLLSVIAGQCSHIKLKWSRWNGTSRVWDTSKTPHKPFVTLCQNCVYFWPKSEEHDVILTSLIAVQSEPWKISLVRMCKINKGMGMQSLVAISTFVLAIGRKVDGAVSPPPPPSGHRLWNIFYYFCLLWRHWSIYRCIFLFIIICNQFHLYRPKQFFSSRYLF